MDVTIDCPCEGKPHAQDTVTLRERLGFRVATEIRTTIVRTVTDEGRLAGPAILAILSEGYVLAGVAAWTLVDTEGKPLPVSRGAIEDRLLSHFDIAWVVGDAAVELYGEEVTAPLLTELQRFSRPTPTAGSTSPPKSGSPKRPKPSRPSLITTSPTDATTTTSESPATDSSSSQSSATAA